MLNRYLIFNLIATTFLFSSEWINNKTTSIEQPVFSLISSDISNTTIEFELDDFYLEEILINSDSYYIVKMKNGASNLNFGMPDLSHVSKSIIILFCHYFIFIYEE